MWSEFSLGVAFAAAILYLPGYLFWRSASFSPVMSLCCAPLFGVCVYAALPIAYYELGIPCNPVSILGPALAFSVVVYTVWRYEMWAGVGSVDDNTPGFEVVLAEGDEMRLYRIADVA